MKIFVCSITLLFVTIYIYIYMDPFGLRGQEGGEVEESRIELAKNRLIFF